MERVGVENAMGKSRLCRGSVNKAVVDDAMDEPVGVECLCLAWLA